MSDTLRNSDGGMEGNGVLGNETRERGRGQNLKVCFCNSKEFGLYYLVNRELQEGVLVIKRVIGSDLYF